MNYDQYFNAIVAYHIAHNYEACRPHIHNGVHAPVYGRPVTAGLTENKLTNGFLAVLNGPKTLQTLITENIIPEEDRDNATPTDLPDALALIAYMNSNADHDGAHIINSQQGTILPVSILSNAAVVRMLNGGKSFSDITPENFFAQDIHTKVKRAHLGTRTQVGLALPQIYPHLATILVRTTAYSPLGLGAVSYITHNGVERMVVPTYKPDSEGPFLDKERGVVLLDKVFKKEDGEVTQFAEHVLDPEELLLEPALK